MMHKVFLIIGIALTIPIAYFEVFLFFTFMAYSDVNNIAAPIAVNIFIALHDLLLKKYRERPAICNFLKFSVILSPPLLALLPGWLIETALGLL